MDFLPLMMLLSGMNQAGNQEQFQVDDMIGQLNKIKTLQSLTSGKADNGNLLNMASSLLGSQAGFPAGNLPLSSMPAQADSGSPSEVSQNDSPESLSPPFAQQPPSFSQSGAPANALSGLLGGMGGKDMQQAMTLMNMIGGMNGSGGTDGANRDPQPSAVNQSRQIKIENRTVNYMPNRKLH